MCAIAIEFTTRDGLPLRANLHRPDAETGPLVLVAHGFKGFKDWGFFPWLADRLAASGLVALRFNFARCGVGDDPLEFDRLDLFRENSISREIEDLEDLTAQLTDQPELAGVATDRFGLFGHSRGGAVSILFADREPRVAALATWAAVCRIDRHFGADALAQWREQKVLAIPNARTGQMMPLGMELYRDLTERASRLDVAAAAARLNIPHLVVHGTDDESVPIADGEAIVRATNGRAEPIFIEDTGHTFGAVHPFAGATTALTRAADETARHFVECLA